MKRCFRIGLILVVAVSFAAPAAWPAPDANAGVAAAADPDRTKGEKRKDGTRGGKKGREDRPKPPPKDREPTKPPDKPREDRRKPDDDRRGGKRIGQEIMPVAPIPQPIGGGYYIDDPVWIDPAPLLYLPYPVYDDYDREAALGMSNLTLTATAAVLNLYAASQDERYESLAYFGMTMAGTSALLAFRDRQPWRPLHAVAAAAAIVFTMRNLQSEDVVRSSPLVGASFRF